MRRWWRIAGFVLLCAAAGPAGAQGHLVLIGGGDKPPEAVAKFVELAGGREAPIVVVPTASTEDDTIPYYLDLFGRELGVTDLVAVDIRTPADARRADHLAALARARGVFFAGGDQTRILAAFADSPALAAVRRVFARGGVIGGTSAGTACQTTPMITGEGDFTVIRSGAVALSDGLGLWPGVVVDQHFLARQRANRLLSVVLAQPALLGVGIDEATAVWVEPGGTFEVLGHGSVMVFDARRAPVSRRPFANGQENLGVHGLRLHLLLPGERFDVARRTPLPPRRRR